MKTFITENFLLQNKTAQTLYHDYAKDMPIIDYHCHLSPKEIAENKRYRSITEMWLDGDHYKWRAIRSAGIREENITSHIGDASYDKQRFMDWASVIPKLIGNPLYHWTHLELLRYFDIDELFDESSADNTYKKTNDIISKSEFNTQYLIKKFKLDFIGTTDDPIDSLEYHKSIKNQNISCIITPSWRPDKAVKIDLAGFNEYIQKLSKVCGHNIDSIDDLLNALFSRMQYFKDNECSISDNGLDNFVFTRNYSKNEANIILRKSLNNETLTNEEIVKYKSYLLVEMGKKYADYGWVMQLHMNVLRNNSTKMFNLLGADSGFDSIGDYSYASQLSAFLDTLDKEESLPKTILYSLNPSDNGVLGTMLGNFQGDGTAAKMQLGSGWWFNDQKNGMEQQMIALANLGLFSKFVGMTTDSRSFLSFSRHEYFRRILCNLIGTWVEEGQAPNDEKYLAKIVKDICYNNAKQFFNIK